MFIEKYTCQISQKMSCSRILLDGPQVRIYYLGDRVCRQLSYMYSIIQPADPPSNMFDVDSIPPHGLDLLLSGIDCIQFHPKCRPYVSHTEFIRKHLMPSFSSKCCYLEEQCTCLVADGCEEIEKISNRKLESQMVSSNYLEWKVMRIQPDSKMKEETIVFVEQHGDQSFPVVENTDKVPVYWYADLLKQHKGLRYKASQKGAEITN